MAYAKLTWYNSGYRKRSRSGWKKDSSYSRQNESYSEGERDHGIPVTPQLFKQQNYVLCLDK